MRRRDVDREALHAAVAELLQQGWRMALVAAHDDEAGLRVVYSLLKPVGQRVELVVRVPHEDAWVPSLAGIDFPTGRFEREIRDHFGIRPEGHPLPQRLTRHGHWPAGYYPMRRDATTSPRFTPDVDSYPFVAVEGQGVYEIPVGPVHAGLIEPGHFRFSVVGETILQVKARLWFLHRGIEKIFHGIPPAQGVALAERISGDTAVGHGLAYVMAVEDALQLQVSEPARTTRALLLELERIHNHVSDIGAIFNDVAFGIANAHAQKLREQLLRHNKAMTGHRLLRGGVGIGTAGVRRDPDLELLRRVAQDTAQIVDIALSNSVVADRLAGTSVLSHQQAQHLGTLGYVARASGVTTDARTDHPLVPLDGFEPLVETAGDVLARLQVRAREVQQSVELIHRLAPNVTAGEETAVACEGGQGLGVVEAWRGTLCHRVEIGEDGRLSRVRAVDPSFFNWPALPLALRETIVPDFPLTNKSFNQSYAGNDL